MTADIISTVEFNHSGELLATGDKGGRVVIFQQEPEVSFVDSCDKCSHTVQLLLSIFLIQPGIFAHFTQLMEKAVYVAFGHK